MTTKPEAINAMPAPPISSTTQPDAIKAPDLTPAVAWSRRVRRVGGLIQAAFAALWLVRRPWRSAAAPDTCCSRRPASLITIGPLLAVTTGIGAGVILLGAAAAGFHDLAGLRPARRPSSVSPATRG
jgi:hypothetical protein